MTGLESSALLLIEFQNEWLDAEGKLQHLFTELEQFKTSVNNAERIIKSARMTPIHIIHSGLSYSPNYKELGSASCGLRAAIPTHQTFQKNSKASQYTLPFSPQMNEFTVAGRLGSSAFSGSYLDNYLRNNHITTLYLMGYALHVCVESTMRASHDLGYETILIHDACSAFTKAQQDHVLNEVVHHFGRSICTNDFIDLITKARI